MGPRSTDEKRRWLKENMHERNQNLFPKAYTMRSLRRTSRPSPVHMPPRQRTEISDQKLPVQNAAEIPPTLTSYSVLRDTPSKTGQKEHQLPNHSIPPNHQTSRLTLASLIQGRAIRLSPKIRLSWLALLWIWFAPHSAAL